MKPIGRIVIALLLTWVLCSLAFELAQKGLNSYSKYSTEQMEEVFQKHTPYDLVYFGSSSVHQFINPHIVDSICGSHSFNAGMDGANILEINMVFEAYLETHTAPKEMLLTLDLTSFDLRRKFYKYFIYFPFRKNTIVNKNLNQYWPKYRLYQLFPFLLFTELDDYLRSNCLKGYQGKLELPANCLAYNGFLSNTPRVLTPGDTAIPYSTLIENEEGLHILRGLIVLCKQKKIHLTITTAPEYNRLYQNHSIHSKKIFDDISEIARSEKITLLRQDSLAFCRHPEFFINIEHLNLAGAIEYSKLIGTQYLNIEGCH
jgi:hypothetical protein